MSSDIQSIAEQAAREAIEGIEFLTIVEIAEEEGFDDITDGELNAALDLARRASVEVGGK